MGTKRILKELQILKNSSDYYKVIVIDDNIFHWEASMVGPKGSPYEDGNFRLDIRIPSDFPLAPPKIRFKTKVYHPNIHLTGSICIDILRSRWNPTYSVETILFGILSLLTDPNAHDPYNARAAFYYRENRQKFEEIARYWTKKYSM